MKKTLFVTVLIFVIFSFCACTTVNNAETQRTVSVSGTGSVGVTADVVTFSISVSEVKETTGLAQQAANKKVSQILGILRSFAIEEKDISTSSISFSSQYRWQDGEQIKVGEEVSQSLFVKMRDIDRFASLIDELGSKVSGVSFYGVSFGADDYSEAYKKARKLAYDDAYEKALTYAESAGLKVGKALEITDGSMGTSTRYSNSEAKFAMAMADESISYGTEVPSGTLNVSVSCSIVFEVE